MTDVSDVSDASGAATQVTEVTDRTKGGSNPVREEILEPDLPIIDAHHHLWVKPPGRYLLEEYAADLATGHRILATVYVESRTALRDDLPPALAPVGETEFAHAVGVLADTGLYGPTRIAAGIVAFADLSLHAGSGGGSGAKPAGSGFGGLEEVLEAHEETAGGRLRGLRHSSYWDADPEILSHGSMLPPRHLLLDPVFQHNVALLGTRGLSFDAIMFHPQLDELVALARAAPGTSIVLNHMGTPLGLGRYAGHRDDVRAQWTAALTQLSQLDNVALKIGGAGRPQWGFGFHAADRRPTSDQLAAAWQPYVATCLELFGPERCMLESNFPADKVAYDYAVFWNAMKKLTADLSTSERAALFSETARRLYRIPDTTPLPIDHAIDHAIDHPIDQAHRSSQER